MREAHSSKVEIDDISHEVMLSILYFLYTDQCKVTLDNVMSLFKAADIYGIRKLKSICEQTIIQNISIENAANIFCEADTHYAD
jgi:speckle-type POZ protein